MLLYNIASGFIGIIEYKGPLKVPDSYLPARSCEEHMLQYFPLALPGVQQLALIVEESQRIASDRLSRLAMGALRLTEDEALAVASYTFDLGVYSEHDGADNLCNQLNDCLRKRTANNIALLKPYLAYLQRALAKFPVVETTVYLGIPAKSLDIVREKYKKDTRVHWSAFTSTSTHIATAKQCAEGQGGIIFRIDVMNGRCLSLYSYSMSEEEILLSPNSAFVVKAECHLNEDGYMQVDMTEVSQ